MIEVGEYVRLKDGKIRQFKQYINEEIVELTRPYSICKEKDIVKHSKKLIDLIELYDYVNGMIVFDIITYDNGKKAIKIPSGYLISENEIQSILTHEQYMQNCYKCQDIENGITLEKGVG